MSFQDRSKDTLLKESKQIGDFIIGKVLGKGTFGKVRMATHKITNQKVAIKFLEKKKISEVADVERVTREIHILKLIRHPNLIQLYQIIETKKQLLLITQFMENGELFDHIVKNTRIKESEACRMFHEIIDGIEYMHKIGVAHRDLKPENILLDYKNSIKIVDFGLSNTYKKDEKLKTPCGSPCYAAPQMIEGYAYNGLKIDIWSCGIILFAMLSGYLPFEDDNASNLYKKVLAGDYQFHDSVGDSARNLVQGILNNNPEQRMTIEQIRNHPWMRQGSMKTRKICQGLRVGYNKIPVDKHILFELQLPSSITTEYVEKCIQANRHNEYTVAYYLLLKCYIRNGGQSHCDLENENFHQSSIEPIRKKIQEQILINNFFNDSVSQDLAKVQKKSNKSRVLRETLVNKHNNKENIGYLINNKNKSKQKSSTKDRSKQKIPLQDHNASKIGKMKNSGIYTDAVSDKNERKSESGFKRLRSGSNTRKQVVVQTSKGKTKLDSSINFGKVPLSTKSVEKSSGRQSEGYHHDRLTLMDNRVNRKYKQKFNQSLISHSKGKLKSKAVPRARIKSSSNNQSIQGLVVYQGMNTTTIAHANSHVSQTMIAKKCKDMNNTGYIEEYLMKSKKGNKKNAIQNNISQYSSSKMLKSKRM